MRFVILEHDHPTLHWDLMLEADDALRSWRLARPPLAGDDRIPATALPDHRKLYLDYQGPISGKRGSVVRWDQGAYHAVEDDTFEFAGARLQGVWRLYRLAGDEWQFARLTGAT